MYHDVDLGVYYGKLPAQPNEEGMLEVGQTYLSWPSYDNQQLVYQGGAYWLFVVADEASTVAYYSYAVTSSGETEAKRHNIVFASGGSAEPAYILKPGNNPWISYTWQPSQQPVQAGEEYTYTIKLRDSSMTLLGIEGQGVEIVSQPDAEGNFTVRFPADVTSWEDESGYGRAWYWIYVCDAEGNVAWSSQQASDYPGKTYSTGTYNVDNTWPEILSENGMLVYPNFSIGSTYLRNWSEIGTVDADAIQVELECRSDESILYEGVVTASYDAAIDQLFVKISELPDTKLHWSLDLTVPYVEGYTLTTDFAINKESPSLNATPIDLVLGVQAGATYRTQIARYNQDNYEYEKPDK